MLSRPFSFYLTLLLTLTPIWVLLRGFAHFTFPSSAAVLLPIVVALSIVSTSSRFHSR